MKGKQVRTKLIWGISSIAIVVLVIFWLLKKDSYYIPDIPFPSAIDSPFTMRDGYSIRLVAKEPDVVNPMSICVDRQGAIYVSESSTYRYGMEGSPQKDSLLMNPVKRIELGPDGKVVRVDIVAQGFANPVMGIDIFENKLYATCLNELFSMDIGDDGQLSNKIVLVQDSAHPWNPFGMYRVAVGPDAKLWLAIADHPDSKPVTLTGSDGSEIKFRGQSGGFVRCNLDGSGLELVVQGFRAPFAFDFDPWGHLWAISNGESSPNIYVEVIPGMDYGYHSRKVSYAWLAGKTNLAPPVTEMGSGANTVAFHYYGSMFPSEFWSSILIGNWGSHGAFPTNRIVKQYVAVQPGSVPDSVKRIGKSYRAVADTFLYTTDSLFRPVAMALAPDGGVYLADWHGRDDESDSTGRIFKIFYEGRQKKSEQYHPDKVAGLNARQWCELLGNRNKFLRSDAQSALVKMGRAAIPELEKQLKKRDAFRAANAIWTLTRLHDSEAVAAMATALKHRDGRIRSLALRQMRQAAGQAIGKPLPVPGSDDKAPKLDDLSLNPEKLAEMTALLLQDPDPEVRIEAALAQNTPEEITRGLIHALDSTADKRLQYQIGFELGRYADSVTITRLYDSSKPFDYRIARIAAQTALNEKSALASAVKDWDLTKDENFAKELIARIDAGKVQPEAPADRLIALEWLEENPHQPNASLTQFLLSCLKDEDYLVKRTALQVVRRRLLQNELIEKSVMDIMVRKDSMFSFMPVEAMYTVASFADPGNTKYWQEKLKDTTANMVLAAFRSLRKQSRNTPFILAILEDAKLALERFPDLKEEFGFMVKSLEKDKPGVMRQLKRRHQTRKIILTTTRL